jgi:putative spermidine/putrescine transport system permease protein
VTITLVIGLTVLYFLAFHIRNPSVAIGVFYCSARAVLDVEYIRMISWIRLLGNTACSIAHFLRSAW